MDLRLLKRLLLGLVLVFSLGAGPSIAFSELEVIVLQSDDERVKAGDSVTVSTVVRLAPQEEIRLLTTNGNAIKVKGPYTGAIGSLLREPTSSSSVKLKELARAIAGRGESRKALGAYRNLGQESGVPRFQESLVKIILGEQSAYCIAPGQKLALWRANSEESLSLTLQAGKRKHAISWLGGVTEISVPDAVLKGKPRRLIISGGQLSGSTRARLWYGKAGDTPGEQLSWYNSRGCEVQFESALTFYQTF
ncbi:MAG: hypothetical protein AB2541_05930 [Candidatus Thiodiazotropha sp.]